MSPLNVGEEKSWTQSRTTPHFEHFGHLLFLLLGYVVLRIGSRTDGTARTRSTIRDGSCCG